MFTIDRLPLIARRLVILPALVLAPLALGASAVQAANLGVGIMLAPDGGRVQPAKGFAIGGGGPQPDTCTESDSWGLCELDDFEQRCEDAGGGLSSEPGGGLSSEPGGGVDCDTSGWE